MDRQSKIRNGLKTTERNCNWYYGKQEFRETYIHYFYRRQWLLKQLLKVQLKEFNRD